jgi:hypothetical protein
MKERLPKVFARFAGYEVFYAVLIKGAGLSNRCEEWKNNIADQNGVLAAALLLNEKVRRSGSNCRTVRHFGEA